MKWLWFGCGTVFGSTLSFLLAYWNGRHFLKKHGLEAMRKTLLIIEKTNYMQYAPVITTPLELEKLGGKLKAFVEKEKITMAPKWKVWN